MSGLDGDRVVSLGVGIKHEVSCYESAYSDLPHGKVPGDRGWAVGAVGCCVLDRIISSVGVSCEGWGPPRMVPSAK